MMTERTAGPNGEPEVEGHGWLRIGATEESDEQRNQAEGPEVEGHGVTPPPTAMQWVEPEVEGHTIIKWRASDTPALGAEPETEGHGVIKIKSSDAPAPGDTGEPEVEGHYRGWGH
jgi:hypothetical protein